MNNQFLLLALFMIIVSFITDINSLKSHFLSDEFIKLINEKHTTWKAGRNFGIGISLLYIEGLLGVQFLEKIDKKNKLPVNSHFEDIDIPEAFDARTAWPNCASVIENIRDQAKCGACWVILL